MRNKEVRNCCINHFQVQRSIHQRRAWSSCPVRVLHCWMVLGLQLGKSLSEKHWVLHLAIFCFKQPSHCCKKKSNSQWKLLRVSCNAWGDLQQPSWASYWWQPVYTGVRSRAKGLSRRGQGSSLGHTQPINRLRGWWQMPNSQEGTPLSLYSSPSSSPPRIQVSFLFWKSIPCSWILAFTSEDSNLLLILQATNILSFHSSSA